MREINLLIQMNLNLITRYDIRKSDVSFFGKYKKKELINFCNEMNHLSHCELS